jgi:predicted transcriptional regulator
MNVEEFKAEAAKLPANARADLADWIEQAEDVRALRRDELMREIQHGLEQADRGEMLEAEVVFARLRSAQPASA